MRKADEGDEVVAARLRAVLAGGGRGLVARRQPDFADRGPVAWSELIPSWPDDVDLGSSAPVAAPDLAGMDPPSDGDVLTSRGAPPDLAVRDPWGPARIDPSAWTSTQGAGRSGSSAAGPPVSGDPLDRAGGHLQRLPDSGDIIYVPDRQERSAPGDDSAGIDEVRAPALGGVGAFGAGGGRFGAFDPGRRGTKALAVVAAVVVLVAAFLAWRARPRVDPIADPPPVPAGSADVPAPAGDKASAPSAVVVAVEGKVAKPGVVRLPAGARVADALAAAGGARPGVDTAMLNLARKVVDGELILVGVTPAPGTTVAAAPGAAPAGPVNLNTATIADLDALPGVGPVLAQRILDARTAQGGFRAVSDLRNVEGIGSSRYEQLKELVTV